MLRAPGYRIRALQSAVDGSTQYYNLIVPERGTHNGPMPLMLLAPPAFLPTRPFLESRLVAHIEDINRYAAMAQKYGYVVAMAWARGNSPDEELRERDLLEVIADVERWYPIDRDRVYGYGVCDGGSLILGFAANRPKALAAVGTLAPAGASATGSPARVPILIMHSVGDTSIPFANSVELARTMRSSGMDVTLELLSGGTHTVTVEDTDEIWWAFTRSKRRQHR